MTHGTYLCFLGVVLELRAGERADEDDGRGGDGEHAESTLGQRRCRAGRHDGGMSVDLITSFPQFTSNRPKLVSPAGVGSRAS